MQADFLSSGLRGLLALGTANNGGNAGVGCLNGNNGPGNAWVNNGAALNDTYNFETRNEPSP